MVPVRPCQLSQSCLHSTMDTSRIKDGPFYFWGRVENICLSCTIVCAIVCAHDHQGAAECENKSHFHLI